MTIRVGIIGTGLIGEDHGRKLVNVINGSTVIAVTDVNLARAEEVANELGGAAVFGTGMDLIASPTRSTPSSSPRSVPRTRSSCSPASRPANRSCARSRSPQLSPNERRSSRPRSPSGSVSSSWATCAATTPATGRSRRRWRAGPSATPLILHNVHRNATVGEAYTSFMTMTDSMIHEVDTSRWLLGEEITAVQVIPPKRTPKAFPHLQDPQFAVFTTESGILSTVEFFANCQYGYDVRCELVGSLGTASMVNPALASTITAGTLAEVFLADWRAASAPRTPPNSRPGSPGC